LVNPMISHPEACAMVSRSNTPGMRGIPGKCPSKMVELFGISASAWIVLRSTSSATTRSISWKYSRRMQGWASSLLGSDELVDAGAQILHDEILFRGGLPLVDFLGPLLDRHLDAERLVDRKGDVEEV